MFGSEVEHVHSSPRNRPPRHNRHSSQQSNQSFHDALESPPHVAPIVSSSPSVSILPAATYARSPPVVSHAQSPSPSPSTNLPNQQHNLNGVDRVSPDPHEYYRPYRESSSEKQDGLVNQRSASPTGFDSGMTVATYPRKTSISSVQSDATQPNGGYSRQYRSTSSTSNRASSDGPRTYPSFPAHARARQPSFKDLIEKFNKTLDEVPPLPSQSSSRVQSRAASPAGSAGGHPRSHASSTTKSGTRPRDRSAQWRQPVERPEHGDLVASTSHGSYDRLGRSRTSLGAKGVASQSLVDLDRSDQPARRPLFGELLAVNTAVNDPGYGIPSHPRRRGSEGSTHSPNPRILDSHFEPAAGVSPSSPTAWYLGYTPSLEAVNTGANPNNHRRTRSDFSGSASKPAIASSLSTHMAVPSPREPASASSAETPHSKSRIPIPARRLSHASDSGNSSPSTRANSSVGLRTPISPSQAALPPKGTSRLPKPSPISPTRTRNAPASPLSVTSPGRRERAHGYGRHQQPVKSPLLQAYITAPPPKKSPPLRSSRPRQPVSTATTSASRAKTVERLSGFQKQNNYDRDVRNPRSRVRMLPELGNVDFAARRQKIQQAFNKTVEENAKREEAAELRRRAKVREDEERDSQLLERAKAEEHRKETESLPLNDSGPRNSESEPVDVGNEQGKSSTTEGRFTPAPPQLTVDTASPPQPREDSAPREQSRFDSGDSPTLGLPHKLGHKGGAGHLGTRSSDIAPSSALTAETNDTDITSFDPEPQAGLPQPGTSHKTVLSQIMQMRESSPSSPTSSEDHDYSSSDRDDKESIQIMLRETAYFDDSIDGSDNQERPGIYEEHDHMSDELRNRWSMSSWSSSVRHQHSADDQIAQSGEDIEVSLSAEEINKTPQPWSAQTIPFSNSDPRTGQFPTSKHISETRNGTQYHAQGPSNPPSLARQGGWDSRRVTQLYLEELARGKIHGSLPSVSKFSEDSPELAFLDVQGETTGRTNSLTDDPVLVSRFEGIPEPDHIDHRASLVLRDDWEHASPSIADWMQLAAEDAPQLPPKKDTGADLREGAPTPHPMTSGQQLSTFEDLRQGLGLAIHVHSPQERDAPVIPPPPPPLPDHSPPPPPSPVQVKSGLPQPPMQPSPSIYSSQPPSSVFPSAPVETANYFPSARSSEESSLHYPGHTPSPQTLGSSATSQPPSGIDQTKVEAKRGTPSPEQRRLKKRRHVIKELVDTEYTFGRDMKVVDDIYKGTSSSCLDLSAEDVKTLFSNSEQVVQFSMTFQDALKKAARTVYIMPKSQRWSSKRGSRVTQASTPSDDQSGAELETSDLEKDRQTFIGEAFTANMAQMEKVYTDYLKNHDSANKKLETLQRNPKVAIWLKECREWASDLTSAWNLDSLLVKPVQRILKYPLLLTELLNATPQDHPDHAAIAAALEGVTNISVRINEMKKRADLVGQVVGRKRKESDVRAGLSKAFGRRTEKLKQHVGLSDMFEDKDYDVLSQRFGDSFFQLQVVMRDVEMYTREVQSAMDRFSDFIVAIEAYIDVAQSNYTELESKWRRFRMAVREIMMVALPDHLATVRKSVIEPMVTLLKLHDGPQRVMHKRNKRLVDYARFKALKDRDDKPDKKTTEQGEQFVALNETLKDELPKLFSLTAKLMESCLNNFVQIQTTWFGLLQKKLGFLIDRFPDDLHKIISDWSGDFDFAEAQVLSLGICNGSMLADAVNLVNFNTPSTGADMASPRRPSTINSANTRSTSFNMDGSPKVSHDLTSGSSFVQSPPTDGLSQHSNGSQAHLVNSGRNRANSSISGRIGGSGTLETSNGQALQSMSSPQGTSTRPGTGSGYGPEPFPSLPRLSLDTPFLNDVLVNSAANGTATATENPTSPGGRYSGFFSSAMPMSDSPRQESPPDTGQAKDPKVLFLAASIYEFNIDRARREAGYPYLTYVAGEIFDVIAEKGELWLAKNQDDPTRQVGWIWNKHFAKLAA